MLIIFNILHYYLHSVKHETEELVKTRLLYLLMIQNHLRSTDDGR
jgi:hypothetical protein